MSTKEKITMGRRVLPSGTIVVDGRRYHSDELLPYSAQVVHVEEAATGLKVFDGSGRLICDGLQPEHIFEMSNTTRRPAELDIFFQIKPLAV